MQMEPWWGTTTQLPNQLKLKTGNTNVGKDVSNWDWLQISVTALENYLAVFTKAKHGWT